MYGNRCKWLYYDSQRYVLLMVLSDITFEYFLLLQSKVRASFAKSASSTPFSYDDEDFFQKYNALQLFWTRRKTQRETAKLCSIGRKTLKEWEKEFVKYGVIGLLPEQSSIKVEPNLERIVLLVKEARPHEQANYALRLADALQIEGASLEIIRRIQRSYGFGQRQDKSDRVFYKTLQHIVKSVASEKRRIRGRSGHDASCRFETFINFDKDSLQQRIELFHTLSRCAGRRQIRPVLQQYGIHPNRYYELKERYMLYGVWGLVDLNNAPRQGEKISSETELKIVEERIMDSTLSAQKMIKKLGLKCSRARVLSIYKRWQLAKLKIPVVLRGVIPTKMEDTPIKMETDFSIQSAKMRFPRLLKDANLKVNRHFSQLMAYLTNRKVPISNPGALIIAPFLDQLGVVEALHTYGPECLRSTEITNNIIVNVLRIIAGFPSINDFTLSSDSSVAIGAGMSMVPRKSRFYESFDDLRFHHLQKLRNDASVRAKELGIIEGKEIAIDYHCDQSDSRFPLDKSFSKSPDKKGDMVFAHRPQILWDSVTNSIINIAYCEGRSRAPTALYRFLEDNLFKVIDHSAIDEIYADSEYTGEKQLIYLIIRASTSVTMCLKQNKKIKQWKEDTLQRAQWLPYGKKYRIATSDYVLSQTSIPFRFVIKQNLETNEIRCFGSTHTDMSPQKILDAYHLRWPVETGIRDLLENYFLNRPTGTSAEKSESHYYCVMLARQCFDFFISIFSQPKWKTPQGWDWLISTIRTTLFSNQNCELTLNESGDLELIYLDGDPLGLKKRLIYIMEQLNKSKRNSVSWWGGKALSIKIENRFSLGNGLQID